MTLSSIPRLKYRRPTTVLLCTFFINSIHLHIYICNLVDIIVFIYHILFGKIMYVIVHSKSQYVT